MTYAMEINLRCICDVIPPAFQGAEGGRGICLLNHDSARPKRIRIISLPDIYIYTRDYLVCSVCIYHVCYKLINT